MIHLCSRTRDIFLEELDNVVIDFNLTDLHACNKWDWEL